MSFQHADWVVHHGVVSNQEECFGTLVGQVAHP